MLSKVGLTAWALTILTTGVACHFAGIWGSCVICVLVGAFILWLLPTPPPLALDDPSIPKKRSWLNDDWKKDKLPKDIDTVVIGSGMAGLSCAAVLARNGRRVVVFEQHDVVGGATHTFDLKGYKFDSGLHYTVPWHGHLFKLIGLTNNVPPCDPLGEPDGTFDKIVLGENEPFKIQANDQHIYNLYKMFPEEKKGLDAFVKATGDVLLSVRFYIVSKLFSPSIASLYWKLVPSRFHPSTDTIKNFLDTNIKNPKLKSLLCSLWIDSGGRPDEATFMLTGAVQRGLPLEGGYYPRGGPEEMGRFLISIILQHGGRVFVKAAVKQVLVEQNKVVGVQLADGTRVNASMVVSAAGYLNTFQRLVPESVSKALSIPTTFPTVRQSNGFMMCNIGIKGTPEELGLTNANIWYLPATKDGDMFKPMEDYFRDPLNSDIPCMITWPSIKDSASTRNGKVTCQMLSMADNRWFQDKDGKKYGLFGSRTEEYEQIKKKWEDKFLQILYRHYPKVEGRVELSDMSTPLTINHYLWAPDGAACGLELSAERFSQGMQKYLDASTPIHGLWLTGQDTLICGVILAQLSGVISACRALGPIAAAKLFLQSIYFL